MLVLAQLIIGAVLFSTSLYLIKRGNSITLQGYEHNAQATACFIGGMTGGALGVLLMLTVGMPWS